MKLSSRFSNDRSTSQIAIILSDEKCPNEKILMNKVIRKNLRVHNGDVVRYVAVFR